MKCRVFTNLTCVPQGVVLEQQALEIEYEIGATYAKFRDFGQLKHICFVLEQENLAELIYLIT
jgi:hypothetical protein